MSLYFKYKRLDPLNRIAAVLLVLIFLFNAGCSAWVMYALCMPRTHLKESKSRFALRAKELTDCFGKDAVSSDGIKEYHEVYLSADIKLSDTDFSVQMQNKDRIEEFRVNFKTPVAASREKALPNRESLSNAAEIVEILSGGEYSKQYMTELLEDILSDMYDDLHDPEVLEERSDDDWYCYHEFVGRLANSCGFSIDDSDEGFYTSVHILFSCFDEVDIYS